ncbi:MAG: CPCC family cysteine-rich protein [Oscillospiraceae bacterium]|nr:hypothetical protein [Oscillospiraceae bacterium]
MNKGLICPVCGKYEFEDFNDFDDCSECGWKINITQYDDHDFSDGYNPLSVNECKLEYALLKNSATAERARALKAAFVEEFRAVRKAFRDGGRLKTGITCEQSRSRESAVREEYVQKLRELAAEK